MAAPTIAPQTPSRQGNLLYVPQSNTALPPYCVKCGRPSTTKFSKTFFWHHPAILLVILISPIIYIIVALIVRKKMALEVPLCDEHAEARKKKKIVAWVLLLGFLPAGIAVGLAGGIWGSEAAALGWLVGIAMLVVGLVYAVLVANFIAPTRIDNLGATFKKVSEEFLRQLPAAG